MSERPLVTVETSAGNLVLELAPEEAPETVANFLHYVQAGFYPGTVWHRVIPRFVAQAGGYSLDGRKKAALRPPIKLERSGLKHTDGALGMARLAEPSNSATSEFYLCDGPQRDLDGNYCVFGRLFEGRDVLTRILSTPTKEGDWPVDPPVILRAYVGKPDPSNPAPKYAPPSKEVPPDIEAVRAAARKLRGKAALMKARNPLMSLGDVENAVAHADRTGKRSDLERAEKMLADKESRK